MNTVGHDLLWKSRFEHFLSFFLSYFLYVFYRGKDDGWNLIISYYMGCGWRFWREFDLFLYITNHLLSDCTIFSTTFQCITSFCNLKIILKYVTFLDKRHFNHTYNFLFWFYRLDERSTSTSPIYTHRLKTVITIGFPGNSKFPSN